uniref:Uncharacterized protein n=1 Tax=Physcomitrium patens TaxID=3218 RepID=A0A2K1IV67_PHYPA|nr:hypothetical protein PHYPA_025118 [Physcomitrium patens]PNR33177.1 hypothetical protein PHYPA_025120 [Physcomitrium patens]
MIMLHTIVLVGFPVEKFDDYTFTSVFKMRLFSWAVSGLAALGDYRMPGV